MAKSKLNRKSGLRVGEIIRFESLFGLPPSGTYQVDAICGDMYMISAGEIRAGISLQTAKIIERNLPKPNSWLSVEIDLIQKQLLHCDCPDCKALLYRKQHEQLSQVVN